MRFDLLRTSSEQNRKLPAGTLQPGSMWETYFKEGTQMISTLKKKLNKKGFTLAELLIVVAIIAVLVAIAVPVFSTQLEKSRIAVDTANARSANSVAVSNYLMYEGTGSIQFTMGMDANGNIGVVSTTPTDDGTADASGNAIKAIEGKVTGSMKTSSTKTKGKALTVTVENGKVTANSWFTAGVLGTLS